MGIPGLWKLFRGSGLLKRLQNLALVKGKCIAIDCSVLLHSFFGMDENYILYGDAEIGLAKVKRFHDELRRLSVCPVYVFDGNRLEGLKVTTNEKRRQARAEARSKFQAMYAKYCSGFEDAASATGFDFGGDDGRTVDGRYSEMMKVGFSAYQTTTDLMVSIFHFLELQDYDGSKEISRPTGIVATGEADGVLADLCKRNIVWALATIDSDLLLSRQRIINIRSPSGGLIFPFSWDIAEVLEDDHVQSQLSKLAAGDKTKDNKSHERLFGLLRQPNSNRVLAELAILAGCDYTKIRGMAINTAIEGLYNFYRKNNSENVPPPLDCNGLVSILKAAFPNDNSPTERVDIVGVEAEDWLYSKYEKINRLLAKIVNLFI